MPDSPSELHIVPFNPLAREHLEESVSLALRAQPCYPSATLPTFDGAGVYAIYYRGPSPYYAPIAAQNQSGCNHPIYVGKPVPPGSRRGIAVGGPGRALSTRLRQHAESIRQVHDPATPGDLDIADFHCQFLVVEDVWIPLIESLSITQFKPPWNGFLDGFGHHDQGRTRRQQERSLWDTLHPGRPWAMHFRPNRLSAQQIALLLHLYYADPAAASVQCRLLRQGSSGSLTSEDAADLPPH